MPRSVRRASGLGALLWLLAAAGARASCVVISASAADFAPGDALSASDELRLAAGERIVCIDPAGEVRHHFGPWRGPLGAYDARTELHRREFRRLQAGRPGLESSGAVRAPEDAPDRDRGG